MWPPCFPESAQRTLKGKKKKKVYRFHTYSSHPRGLLLAAAAAAASATFKCVFLRSLDWGLNLNLVRVYSKIQLTKKELHVRSKAGREDTVVWAFYSTCSPLFSSSLAYVYIYECNNFLIYESKIPQTYLAGRCHAKPEVYAKKTKMGKTKSPVAPAQSLTRLNHKEL